MIRGFYKYTCKDCGYKFIGADMEWNATIASYPVKCPKCGSLNTKRGIIPVKLEMYISWVKEKLFRKK